MCFVVLEHDKRPMKVRGERVVAATVIPLHAEALAAAAYINVRTGHSVQVRSVGLLADAALESRPAYAAMHAVGVTLDQAGREVTPNDVYVPLNFAGSVEGWNGELLDIGKWPVELAGLWLPARFGTDTLYAEGWLRVFSERYCEMRVTAASLAGVAQVRVTPLYAANLQTIVTGLEQADEWNPRQWLRLPFTAQNAVTA